MIRGAAAPGIYTGKHVSINVFQVKLSNLVQFSSFLSPLFSFVTKNCVRKEGNTFQRRKLIVQKQLHSTLSRNSVGCPYQGNNISYMVLPTVAKA